MGKILIIAGGGIKHLKPFDENAKSLNIDLTVSSFSSLSYSIDIDELFVGETPLKEFNLIYIRLVGKRFEDLSLLVHFAKRHGIKIVDKIYQESLFARLPLGKSLETKLLSEAGISVPKTFYGSLNQIALNATKLFGFPFVIKSTTGKQGHEVWSPKTEDDFNKLMEELVLKEKTGKRYLAQEFIKSSQRTRVFVVGEKALGAITRPTKWRKRFTEKEVERKALIPVPKTDSDLAVNASKSLGIDIAGVDIIHDEETKMSYVLEVNSAPRWESIRKDTGIDIETEILKYLVSLV